MVLIALVALVAIGGLVSTIPSEQKQSTDASVFKFHSGQCESENGVSLVVDFGPSSKRDPLAKCVIDFAGNGWQVFAAAQVEVSGTDEFPTGFVCRVDGWPSKDSQPCTSTPTPAQGTWAYFVASEDTFGEWQFSGQGASMHKPACGSVEGWRFVEPGEVGSQSLPALKPETFSCK
jgi:hypothetical protein